MSLFLLILRFAWPFLLVGGAYLWADEGWHNAVAKRAEKHAVTAEGKIRVLESRFDELDRLRIAQDERWAQVTAAEELRVRADAARRDAAFAALRNRIHLDTGLAALSIPAPVFGVLNDAFAAADPARAAAEPKDTATADPKASALADWATDIYQWTAECRDRVSAWERFYNGLRESK